MRRFAEHGFTSLRRSAEHGFTPLRRCAEHGFTSLRRSAEHGFTPDPRGRLSDAAERFAARARAAHDSAIVEARPVSVWVSGGGYGFDMRSHGSWQPISEKPLTVARWGKDIAPVLSGERDRIVFDSTGLADRGLDVRLVRDGDSTTVRIGTDGSVKIGG